VLEGIVKHETEYDKTDALDYDPHLRGHLEAQITNVADELAYTAHDLDDGLRSGMITTDMLSEIDLWNMVMERLNIHSRQLDDLTRHSIIRELIGLEVDSMISESNERLQRSGVKTLADLQSHAQNVVGFDDVMRARNRELKDFLYKNMYRHYRVVRMQKKAERILSELFHAYVSEPNMLPIHFQDQLEIKGKEKTICDYLAGMTDRFAVDEYQKLFDPSLLP
jgi:dGTPase